MYIYYINEEAQGEHETFRDAIRTAVRLLEETNKAQVVGLGPDGHGPHITIAQLDPQVWDRDEFTGLAQALAILNEQHNQPALSVAKELVRRRLVELLGITHSMYQDMDNWLLAAWDKSTP